MLTALSIRDVVLIEALELEFGPGLGVLTGETGAGKSILLDALGLALGRRGESSLVRSGAAQAVVTATFDAPATVAALLEENGLDVEPGEPLIVRRIVRVAFEDSEARQLLARNNRTSPYLWIFAAMSIVPAVLFWNRTLVLALFCLLFVVTYVVAYLMIVRFKVPRWLRP